MTRWLGKRRAFGWDAGRLDGGPYDRLEEVRVVVVMNALEHSRDAFQPHAGVD